MQRKPVYIFHESMFDFMGRFITEEEFQTLVRENYPDNADHLIEIAKITRGELSLKGGAFVNYKGY